MRIWLELGVGMAAKGAERGLVRKKKFNER